MSPRNSAKADALSREAVVEQALALADAEGLDAVTIRGISQHFGVTPMALYWHVKNKDELLDAMADRLLATVDYATDATATWDQQLQTVVLALVAAFRAHPASVELVYRRIFLSPDGLRLTEYTLGFLRRAGFTRRQTADVATHALQTAMMLVAAEPGAENRYGQEDQSERLAEKRAGLQLLPIEQYPYLREMAEDMLHCDDADEYYRFGADMFVAGARATLARMPVAAQSGA